MQSLPPTFALIVQSGDGALAPASWDDPADWPEDVFCSRLDGSCLEPIVPDRAVVVFRKSESVRAGDFVGVWFRPERLAPGSTQSVVKRLKMDLPPRFTGGNAEGVTLADAKTRVNHHKAALMQAWSDYYAGANCMVQGNDLDPEYVQANGPRGSHACLIFTAPRSRASRQRRSHHPPVTPAGFYFQKKPALKSSP